MSLAPGTRVGPYQIIAALGAGGMGEVYRARDGQLDRDVALKVLPAAFATDADRLARFGREAKTLAALNHPHIAHLYGLEPGGSTPALVMELVEGEDLSRRLSRGPCRVNEAVAMAQQVADALDAAHEQGIVHRDLKPSNIKVRADGVVKLLDFGLAKALAQEHADSVGGVSVTATFEGTQAGRIVGTAAYMSPEQARGKAIDKRTDVWAFGCLLYEMLTARPAFGGETVSDTIAGILEREPDWALLPADTPPRIRLLLRRCLVKDIRHRLRDMGDARLELEEREEAARSTAEPRRDWRRVWSTAALVAVISVAATTVGLLWMRPGESRPRPVVFTFSPPAALAKAADGIGFPVPSPDGRLLAFIASDGAGPNAVWVQRLDSNAAQPLPGTEGATTRVFWSPDSRFIGFYVDGRFKKVEASGGPVVTICASPGNLGATWGADNTIVLAPINRSPLMRVSAGGGTPEPITTLNAERRENSHRYPSFLPDGRRFLFTARSDVRENNIVYVGSLDSGDVRPVIAAQSQGRYAPPGYLLIARDGTLMAQPFDARTVSLSGEATPVAARVTHSTTGSSAGFAVSLDGSVLVVEGAISTATEVVWYTRDGARDKSVGPRQPFTDIRLAPDGRRAAVVIPDAESGNRDISILNLASGALTRLTSHPANDWQPTWSPDSKQIAFATDRHGRSTIYQMPADGGDEQPLLQIPEQGAFPNDWSSDGRFLTLNLDSTAGLPRLLVLPLFGDRTPVPLNRTVAPNSLELEAILSPDAQWVAYQSNESGRNDVYVKPLSRPGKVRVSTEGGIAPRWRGDGRELYYKALNGAIMAAAVRLGEPVEISTPVRLFSPCPIRAQLTDPQYDAAKDGSRFVVLCAEAQGAAPVTVSVGWAEQLAR